MPKYPVYLTHNDGTIFVTSPDFPELSAFGDTEYDALSHAVSAFREAIAARRAQGRAVPPPSEQLDGQKIVDVPE